MIQDETPQHCHPEGALATEESRSFMQRQDSSLCLIITIIAAKPYPKLLSHIKLFP